MRIGRFDVEGQARWGFMRDEQVVFVSEPAQPGGEATAETRSFLEVGMLAPVVPSKVIAVGLNYRDHAAELQMQIPDEPLIFMKPSSSVIGPGQPIVCPARSVQVDYEGELAIVIGATCRSVSVESASQVILGYTCGNDVTARDLQQLDGQWTRAKSFDTFCPVGPWIETSLDTSDLRIETLVNGEVRQSSSTKEMIFTPAELVSFVSGIMTLEAGDVILTGTPPGVGPVRPGDTVGVRIQGIGELVNPVLADPRVAAGPPPEGPPG